MVKPRYVRKPQRNRNNEAKNGCFQIFFREIVFFFQIFGLLQIKIILLGNFRMGRDIERIF